MFRRALSFRPQHLPYMVRHSYLHELRAAMTFPLTASLAEGSFTGVIAAKHFEGSVVLTAVITAAPMFGNIAAMAWSELARGRRKVPLVNLLQLGVVLMVASVALTALVPISVGGWIFAAQIVIARVLASGIVTIRSVIWRANYPRQIRGQVTSRIAAVATTVLAATTFIGSFLLDRNPWAYVYIYPVAALLGLIGIWQFSQIRVRRETSLRRREAVLYAAEPDNLASTDEANVQNYVPPTRMHLSRMFTQAWQVLRDDKPFRDYQRWQMLSGFAFMMMGPSLLFMVSTEMTDAKTQYLLATVVVQIIPMIVSIIATQLWAPLFDRVHITVFRVFQGTVSVAAILTIFAGAELGDTAAALAIVAFGQLLIGITNGGGNLAWNLGHNDFATGDKAALYMGVHVMLTGLRGCLAPFLGAWLYQSPYIGRGVFLLAAGCSLASLIGFWTMARTAPKKLAPTKPGTQATIGTPPSAVTPAGTPQPSPDPSK